MNALPSFNPPPQSPQPPQTTRKQSRRTSQNSINRRKSRAKSQSNSAYIHRRQGLEALVKLITYSTLSVLGIGTLVNLLSYNWKQQPKLEQVSIQVKDAKVRSGKIQTSFSQSFDPKAQEHVVEKNSYKTVPNRLPIIISPKATQSSTATSADSQ